MNLITLFLVMGGLVIGSILGYLARQSIARKKMGTIEAKLREKISRTKEEAEQILNRGKQKALQVLERAKKDEDQRRKELRRTEQLLVSKENRMEERLSGFEKEKDEIKEKVEKLKKIKKGLEELKEEGKQKLEKISGLSKAEAKKELLAETEKEYQAEILEKLRKLENDGREKYEKRAKEILSLTIQKYAIPQTQEITTSTVSLPNEEIKGRIIGKEGRNIKTLEKLTGVEIVVDETPETVIISGFNPVRRQIAKRALEKLIQDGRIQPARIEKIVTDTEAEITKQIKKAGEQAVYDTGVIGLDPKLVQLLGRLWFRTSFGQNVLLHSIEVAHLSGSLAAEIGADVQVAKKAGLLHDIGKAVDHQIQGSHVEIGIKILEKFGAEKEIIDAMKAHHEEYPYESLESVIVQTADAISGSRPGARKDTLENYLKRLGELENIALSFSGVAKAWALQAGKEIRVFVKPEEIDDLTAQKLAREIAKRVQEELKYPGEIKVNVIRETRVIEYAR